MATNTVRIWDPFVRIFHWLLVGAFVVAYVSEDDYLDIHTIAGYTVLTLLMLRLIWGFVGTRHARFSDFVRPPSEALDYVKESLLGRAKRYLGHNPAGGLMIVAILVSLLVTTFSGIVVLGAEEGAGPLAGVMGGVSHSVGEAMEEVHEFFANFTLGLVFVHLAGVLFESLLHRENLVRAMITGDKPALDDDSK
ncbi:cytochrome b/b6 domain-containing protein [Alcanivorax sp. 1008]|uniref:cytochrome b/b6 domain-containing protein n=1 Tax=Alcanivorax sp. 1008 TaxID=2816853 RepID=UPI001DA6F72B|nr:cytochrome b/b6 domain-containing protein [Alcanivorax sp. 1008]MCC1497391.1 cytochrome b/b6 domain-containing protein [Alcanivorax sp. 1008]